jgi:hypothetical protein
MSFDAIRWALRQELPTSEKLVLVALADCHNGKTNRCNPAMQTIAKTAGITRRGAINIIQRLEQRGTIQVEHSPGWRPNNYLLTVNSVHSNTVNEDHGLNQRTVNDVPKTVNQSVENSERGSHEPGRTTNEPVKDRQPSVVHGGKPPACPHQEIISLYHATLPMCPEVRVWNDKRKRYLQARWKEERERQSPDWWRHFFEYVGQSQFLTGKVNGSADRTPFLADLEWIVTESNFVKIIEGKYHRGNH